MKLPRDMDALELIKASSASDTAWPGNPAKIQEKSM